MNAFLYNVTAGHQISQLPKEIFYSDWYLLTAKNSLMLMKNTSGKKNFVLYGFCFILLSIIILCYYIVEVLSFVASYLNAVFVCFLVVVLF